MTYYVREWRLIRNLTQEQLAEQAGLRVATISNLENGHVEKPRGDTLEAISVILRIPVSSLERNPFLDRVET